MEPNKIVEGISQHMQESGVVLIDKKVVCLYSPLFTNTLRAGENIGAACDLSPKSWQHPRNHLQKHVWR